MHEHELKCSLQVAAKKKKRAYKDSTKQHTTLTIFIIRLISSVHMNAYEYDTSH